MERERAGAGDGDGDGVIRIEVVYLPHISNFTDFDVLEAEAGVALRYVGKGEPISDPDVLIIPGSKSTISDLEYLKQSGYAAQIQKYAQSGRGIVIGICGGYQMLCDTIIDPEGVESSQRETEGLGLIPAKTVFEHHKLTNQVRARVNLSFYSGEIEGYEIHMGRTYLSPAAATAATAAAVRSAFTVIERSGRAVSDDGGGAVSGNVIGTYIHGLFDNDEFRHAFLNYIHMRRGESPLPSSSHRGGNTRFIDWDKEYDKLAELVRSNIDMEKIYEIINDSERA